MSKHTAAPRITFMLLSDAHKIGEHGKVDSLGIFTRLFVFGLPAIRESSLCFGFDNVEKGQYYFTVWLKHGRKKAKKFSEIKMETLKSREAVLFAYRVPFEIEALGDHSVGISLGRTARPNRAYWIPLNVSKLPWPELPVGEALQTALLDPHVIKRVQATIVCQKCSRKYVFEALLDTSLKASRGARVFPGDGRFECQKCNHPHFLKDIEGQLRSQLGKSTLGETK